MADRNVVGPFWVSLGRVTASHGDDFWTLRIQDVVSGKQAVEIKMSDAELAQLLAARQMMIERGYIHQSEDFGRMRESTIVQVTYQEYGDLTALHRSAQLIAAEYDRGAHPDIPWQVVEERRWNVHRCYREGGRRTYAVTLARWVPVVQDG